MPLKYVDEIDLEGQRVLARFDFNTPLEKGVITDTTRIDQAMPTIRYILEQGASRLILMSHLGRPGGKIRPEFSLGPVGLYLAEQLGEEVILTESCLDKGIRTLLNLGQSSPILLQNLRFHPEETAGDRSFAKKLAAYGDIYVNDAFGAIHRKHASTYQINAFFKDRAVGGFLLKREIEAIQKIIENPRPPFVAIMGGAKTSDKIKVIERLWPQLNTLIIGGAMAYPFLKAQGREVGESLCSPEDVQLARGLLSRKEREKLILPIDHLVSPHLNGGASVQITEGIDIPPGLRGWDIGPQTLELFRSKLMGAQTIFWNGPMGFFEREEFAQGTLGMVRILAELPQTFTFVGGGDSLAAVKKSGLAHKISHLSTGGGASLEFLEQGTLPGIQALKFGLP